jgi:DNA-directed RNA polymerase specialized sigma24 family protein
MLVVEIERTNHEGYLLFERAIVGGDEEAWAELAHRYRPMLVYWAHRYTLNMSLGDSDEDIADHALLRAWTALSPERFECFPNLPALLAYLRSCVTGVAMDLARAQRQQARLAQQVATRTAATPEQLVVAKLTGERVWQLADSLTTSEQERVVLRESFVMDLPPRVILERHPQLFADVAAVYRAKRNLLERLERNRELRALHSMQ